MATIQRNTLRTRAAFLLPGHHAWTWLTWSNHHASKHAAIIAKATEIGAVGWDFGNADHDFADRVSY